MIGMIKRMLAPPSPEMLALRELEEARRALLAAQSAAEYADAISVYNQARIERLENFLSKIKGATP